MTPFNTIGSMGDPPILFSTRSFVSSLINKVINKGLAGFTGIPFLEEAHFRHLNQPDLYIDTMEGAFDPSCKLVPERRTSETKTRSHLKTIYLNRCLIIKPKREKIPPKRSNNLIFGQINPKLRAKQATNTG